MRYKKVILTINAIFFFIILRFTVTLFNFISDPKLRRVNKLYHKKVSILIPVRNEEENIAGLLNSVTQQDYENYEVIVLDDGSTDNTYKICADFAASYNRFRVIKGKELPGGWLGKNYACHQLAQEASGEYFLFLDADEKINRGLINSAVHRMGFRNLALLSLFTNQEMQTLGENMIVPLMHYILLNLLPIKLIYLLKNPSIAAASGQFMLFDAGIYRKHEWHKMVKNKVVEDVEIMKMTKAANYNGETLLANGMITCRMYNGYREGINGFGKNFLAAFNYNILGFIIFLMLLIGGPMVIIMTLNLQIILLMVGLIILTRIMISLSAGQNAWYNVLLHPLQMASLLLIGFSAIQKHLTKTTIWKGRRV